MKMIQEKNTANDKEERKEFILMIKRAGKD